MTIEEKIDEAIRKAKLAMSQPSAYGYLPEIIEILKLLKQTDNEKNIGHAGALGRLVMDDWDFSESELGTLLGEIADYFLPSAEDVWK